jgi:hypothetical protein
LFNGYGDSPTVFCYQVEQTDYRRLSTGRARLAFGRCRVTSGITREAEEQAFAVVHLGDHNLVAGVRAAPSEEAFNSMAAELCAAFEDGNFPLCFNLLEKHVGPSLYSLHSLFRDQRRAVLSAILDAAVTDVEASARRLYDQYAPLLQFLETPEHPLSGGLRLAGEVTYNSELRKALDPSDPDLDMVEEILAKSEKWNVNIIRAAIPYQMEGAATAIAEELLETADGRASMARLERLVEVARRNSFDVNLWRAQNAFYLFLQRCFAEHALAAAGGDTTAAAWVEQAQRLGAALRVRVG